MVRNPCTRNNNPIIQIVFLFTITVINLIYKQKPLQSIENQIKVFYLSDFMVRIPCTCYNNDPTVKSPFVVRSLHRSADPEPDDVEEEGEDEDRGDQAARDDPLHNTLVFY